MQGFYPGDTVARVRAITGWAQGVDNPTLIPTNGTIGTLYVQLGTLNVWQKQDVGRTVNWVPYTPGIGTSIPNTVAIWNALGVLSASSDLSYDDLTKLLSINTGSIQIGTTAVASGANSFAQGSNVQATGLDTHAEGTNTIANAQAAHAEGSNTNATGARSHSEGNLTTASGLASHSEGENSIASGQGAHAEGGSTTASGIYSHASGLGSIAQADSQTVVGEYNIPLGVPGAPASNDELFTVGNGTGVGSESNAFSVSRDALVQSFAGQRIKSRIDNGAVVTVDPRTDYVVISSLAASNINLPAGVNGMEYKIKSVLGSTINPNGIDTIDGNPSLILAAQEAVILVFNTGVWYVLAGY